MLAVAAAWDKNTGPCPVFCCPATCKIRTIKKFSYFSVLKLMLEHYFSYYKKMETLLNNKNHWMGNFPRTRTHTMNLKDLPEQTTCNSFWLITLKSYW